MTSTKPRRVAARPLPEMWGEDELLSFEEAAALVFPGILTSSSLRNCYRAKKLEVTVLNRKLLTTRRALAAMVVAARRPAKSSDSV